MPESICIGETLSKAGLTFGIVGILIFGLITGLILSQSILRRISSKGFVKFIATATFPIISVILVVGVSFKITTLTLHLAIYRAMGNAESTILELNKYRIAQGHFPTELKELNFNLPTTDICGFQNFSYQLSNENRENLIHMVDKAQKNEPLSIYDSAAETGGYELTVNMPVGILNWNVLVYWPSKKYPLNMKGGFSEKFGKWVYVHE